MEDVPPDPEQTVLTQLLSYERQIIHELLDEDALCIVAAGLGWQRMIAVLLRLHYYQKPGVVLIIGSTAWQKQLIAEELKRHDANITLPTEINAEVQAVERMELYKNSVCCFVSTRILVVDLLSARLRPDRVAGFIVVNAHNVTDMSKEGFAIRLLRLKNRTAFMRAFSDHPTYFTAGFNKVEKTMKALQVRKLCLLPRFHKYVQEELPEVEVHEFAVEMSDSMQRVQEAVATVLEALIKELKRTNKVDSSDLRVEDGLHKSFDEVIKRQLDPIWHTVSWKTRQIVKDLRTLRQLALYLMRYDAVTFLGFLEDLRQSEGTRTVWLFHDATHAMYEQARRRVYVVRSAASTNATSSSQPSNAGPAVQEPKPYSQGGGSSGRGRRGMGRAGRGQKRGRQNDENERRVKAKQADRIDIDVHQSPPNTSTPPGVRAVGSADAGTSTAGSAGSPSVGSSVEPVLEEVPKWALLREVLEEVQRERRQLLDRAVGGQGASNPLAKGVDTGPEVVDLINDSQSPTPGESEDRGRSGVGGRHVGTQELDEKLGEQKERAEGGGNGDMTGEKEQVDSGMAKKLVDAAFAPVVVAAKELHLCQQLEDVMRRGGRAVLQEQYNHYLMSKLNKPRGRLTWRQRKDAERMDLLSGSGVKAAEQMALLAAANRLGEGQARSGTSSKKGGRGSGRGGRGRGGRGKKQSVESTACRRKHKGDESPTRNLAAEEEEQIDVIKETDPEDMGGNVQSATGQLGPGVQPQGPSGSAGPGKPSGQGAETSKGPDEPAVTDSPSTLPDCPLLDGVYFYSLDSHDPFVLWRLQPTFVVLYDPDLAFIRQVEVYKADRSGQPLRVFLLTYEDSLERDAFLSTVERERMSFSQLIDAKQHLVLPVDFSFSTPLQPAPALTGPSADLWLDVHGQNQLTRRAGGRAAQGTKSVPKRIIVDMREFNSSLPPVLHQQGFDIIPVTLEVGDYVLSPEMVVERKSLPDLFGSLNSGRLYSQAEAMTRYYKTPILLIEFEQDKAFTLQSPAELGDDIDPRNIVSKLSLLLLHFPRLRLVWSRNLHNTADVFLSLKSNQDEPDAAAAALVGLPLGADGQPVKGPEAVLNTEAVELLRRLPGVNDTNWRSIMAAVNSLADLVEVPAEKLEEIMGSSKNAKALKTFLDAPCPRQ